MKQASTICAALVVLLASRVVFAQTSPIQPLDRVAALGLGVDIGPYRGVAVGAELSIGVVGLRVRAGYNPVLLTTSNSTTYQFQSLDVFHTGQIDIDVFALPITGATDEVKIGGLLAAKYNTLLGVGAGVAFQALVAINPRLSWNLVVGLSYYPDGEERVAEKQGFPQDVSYNFPFGASLQYGASIGLVFYP